MMTAKEPVGFNMIYCGKAEFGQISRSFTANSGAIHRKRPKNLTQICFPSQRSVKPDRLLARCNIEGAGLTTGKINRLIHNDIGLLLNGAVVFEQFLIF